MTDLLISTGTGVNTKVALVMCTVNSGLVSVTKGNGFKATELH